MPFCSAQLCREPRCGAENPPEFWITAARSFALGEVERMTSVRVVSPEWQGDFSPGRRTRVRPPRLRLPAVWAVSPNHSARVKSTTEHAVVSAMGERRCSARCRTVH